jgi:hypothetical protein
VNLGRDSFRTRPPSEDTNGFVESDRLMQKSSERQRQAYQPGACTWLVKSEAVWTTTVECLAATEGGAYRVAEAEHPGIVWASATPSRPIGVSKQPCKT